MSRGSVDAGVAAEETQDGVDRRRSPSQAGRTSAYAPYARSGTMISVRHVVQVVGERRRQPRRLAGGDRDVPGVHRGVQRARAGADRRPAACPAAPAPTRESGVGREVDQARAAAAIASSATVAGSPSSRPDACQRILAAATARPVIGAAKPTWSPAARSKHLRDVPLGAGRRASPARRRGRRPPRTAGRRAPRSMTIRRGRAASRGSMPVANAV